MSIPIDMTYAGECYNRSVKEYRKYTTGTVMLVDLRFITASGEQLSLKEFPDGTYSTHTVLLNRPNHDYSSWKIIDPTYTDGSILDFSEYMKSIENYYKHGIDFIRIEWKIIGDINLRINSQTKHLEVDWGHLD